MAEGSALVQAKLQYLAQTPVVRGIHRKALLEVFESEFDHNAFREYLTRP